MNRITMAELEGAVDRLNRSLGRPATPYTKDETGKYVANIGNFHLSGAYGGWQLQEMASDSGGVRSHTSGYGTKREVYMQVCAMIRGAELQKAV